MNAPAGITEGGAVERAPVYRLSRVGKTYGRNGVVALEDVDLTLRRGSFTSVIGSSGCGKSTLLKIMAGLIPPSAGRVVLQGKPVTGTRRDIGMMFQQATLFPWRTTIQNIVLPIEIRDGRAAAETAKAKARELLEIVGLQGFEDVYPNELSGGMAQRASICRMLITEPAVLLLDEPFSALDELSRDMMNMELQRICRETRATAFLVTHSIQEAVILSDEIVVMKPRPGRVAEVVTVDLPRPRSLDMMTTPRFGELVDYIRGQLDKGEDM
jgi:NitT/TauT family transport system ATP-binding protein